MAVTSYPEVVSEIETLRAVVAGASLARYGDGEFRLCAGLPAKEQAADLELASRLRDILCRDQGCLIGIPNLQSATPKAGFWERYRTPTLPLLAPGRLYASAFVTRPDSAPWIDTAAYWSLVERLWIDQDVTLVRGSGRSLTAADLVGARSVREIIGPRPNAWACYDALLEQIGRPSGRVLICLGPTATVLAVDLCARDVHAVDCGHLGMFWKKHRRGEPMAVTAADKAA